MTILELHEILRRRRNESARRLELDDTDHDSELVRWTVYSELCTLIFDTTLEEIRHDSRNKKCPVCSESDVPECEALAIDPASGGACSTDSGAGMPV